MQYTQVEIALDDRKDVIWLPMGEGQLKVGQKITRRSHSGELCEWTIIQVCVTLREDSIPKTSKKATKIPQLTNTTTQGERNV